MSARPQMAEMILDPSLEIENAPSVATQAAHGAFWNILFSVLGKLVAFGGQIVLAWFLLPQDIGLAGIALSVTSIVSIVSGTNLAVLLVQKRDAFAENASEIFWLSLTLNGASAIFLIATAPALGHLFKEPRLVTIIFILALTVPLMALPTIYASSLYRDLRFRAIAQIQFGEGLIRTLGSVALAILGFGPYSLVLPQPVSSIYSAASCRFRAGRISLGRPHPERWAALISPILWLMMLALVTALQTSGTIFLIGLIRNSTVTGYYAWGFALSSQAIFLLGHNLQGVFFPVFSKLGDDPKHLIQAFSKACKILTLTIAPICALQIVLARPVIELLFRERWLPAAPVVEWLSVGMITQPLSILGSSLLLARGQYRRLALLTMALMILIISSATAGAYWGREAEIARCTGITLFFSNLVTGWVACRELSCGPHYFFTKLLPSVLAALPLIAIGTLLAFLTSGYSQLSSVITTTVVLLFSYLYALGLIDPRLMKELTARISFLR